MGKDAAQGIQRAGGWGPVFLDGGSGYDLGAALGAVQGRTPRRPAAHERRHVRGDAARPRGAAARDVACACMPIGFRV